MNSDLANITEIFSSIQGEGPYIGCKQIFIRFSGCNLSCDYCDTDHNLIKTLDSDQLLREINTLNPKIHHSISLTGGEPLLYTDFLEKFLPKLPDLKVYLETNGTLPDELEKIIHYVDIIAMDIKIESSTGGQMMVDEHRRFIEVAESGGKEVFIKVVMGEHISGEEVDLIKQLVGKKTLILQPLDNNCPPEKLITIQEEFLKDIPDVRVIPQVHKYLNLQ